MSRLRTVTDYPLIFLSSVSHTSARGLVAHGEHRWPRSSSCYGSEDLARFGLSNRTFVCVLGLNGARNLPRFAKCFLCPRLDTLMIIVGHGANSLARLSTMYTTYEAIRDSCISCFSFKTFSDNHVRSRDRTFGIFDQVIIIIFQHLVNINI